MTQNTATIANATSANLFNAAAALPTPVCVTAFIAPRSLLELSIYSDGSQKLAEGEAVAPAIISVGTYMTDRSIWHICNFTDAAKALKYAFLLKGENCPISKHAFALLQAEIKRTSAASSVATKKAEHRDTVSAAYDELKKKHPDAILLCRVGDFYETFGQDAVDAAEILNITLTRRQKNGETIALAGFPKHALDTYLPRIVRAGRRVAICEDIEAPKPKAKLKKKA